jgi:hypothetical protein
MMRARLIFACVLALLTLAAPARAVPPDEIMADPA